jgi:hypothetical protein
VTDTTGRLAFGKEMRVLFGGLTALRELVAPQVAVPDIHQLVKAALAAYGTFDAFPYQSIVKGIASYQLPRRGPAR